MCARSLIITKASTVVSRGAIASASGSVSASTNRKRSSAWLMM